MRIYLPIRWKASLIGKERYRRCFVKSSKVILSFYFSHSTLKWNEMSVVIFPEMIKPGIFLYRYCATRRFEVANTYKWIATIWSKCYFEPVLCIFLNIAENIAPSKWNACSKFSSLKIQQSKHDDERYCPHWHRNREEIGEYELKL